LRPKKLDPLSTSIVAAWLDDPLQNRTYTLDQRNARKVLYTRRSKLVSNFLDACGAAKF